MSITNPQAIADEINRRLNARPVDPRFGSVRQLPRIECADGFNVSVQASPEHYCAPRESVGPYRSVECGFPSAPMPTLYQWSEAKLNDDADDDRNNSSQDDHAIAAQVKDTVWGCVPILALAEVLASHGGLIAQPVAINKEERE